VKSGFRRAANAPKTKKKARSKTREKRHTEDEEDEVLPEICAGAPGDEIPYRD